MTLEDRLGDFGRDPAPAPPFGEVTRRADRIGRRRRRTRGALATMAAIGLVAVGIAVTNRDPAGEVLIADRPTATADPAPSATTPAAPSPTPSRTAAPATPSPAECAELSVTASRGVLRADLDGDGAAEDVRLERTPSEGTVVTVCYSATIPTASWPLYDLNKPVEVAVLDAEGDGTDELLVWAPTGAAPFSGQLARYEGSDLVLDSGGATIGPPVDNRGETARCVDTDGDGRAELVAVTYHLVDGDTLLTATSVAWTDAAGGSGSFALPDERTAAWLFTIGVCGDRALYAPAAQGLLASAAASAWDLASLHGDEPVGLGLGRELQVSHTPSELGDPDSWVIDVEDYEQFSGPFSSLATLQTTAFLGGDGPPVELVVGRHSHCAGPPLDPPAGLPDDVTQVSLQPLGTTSCIEWFAVNVFLRSNGTAAALTLELSGP